MLSKCYGEQENVPTVAVVTWKINEFSFTDRVFNSVFHTQKKNSQIISSFLE